MVYELVSRVDRGVQTQPATCVAEPQRLSVAACQQLQRTRSRPHTVTILCIALLIIWIGSILPYGAWGLSNPIRGFIASLFLFLVFSTIQLPDGILIRPHPAFWRFIKGVSIFYLALLSFLLCQDVIDVRHWLTRLDSSIGAGVEKNYAVSCDLITWSNPESLFMNVKERLDIFVLAHFMGWMAKALVIRDTRLLWILSIMFEWMEITFRHILPNFWECWWDHLLLDVFGCNWLGIWTGMKLARWFEMKDYDWRWKRRQSNAAIASAAIDAPKSMNALVEEQNAESQHGFFSRITLPTWMESLTPADWTTYKWPPMFASFETYLTFLVFLFGVTAVDVNLFFLKAQLGLEPAHWIVLLRTCFFVFAAAAGTRDLYEFISQPVARRLGLQGWLNLAIVLTEILVIIRFWDVLPSYTPMPQYIQVTWICFIAVLYILGFALWLRSPVRQQRRAATRRKSARRID